LTPPPLTKIRGRSFVVSRIALVLGTGIVSLTLAGCPSLSTMQTPRTVPQGQVRFGIGFEAVGIKTAARTDSASGVTTPAQSVTFPQFEFTARYGLTDNLDIGGKLYLIGAELGLKYQFLRGPLDVAIAPAASYISFGSSSDSSSGSISATYLHLPLLFGLNLNDTVTISFGPKLLYTIASVTTSNSTNDRSSAATSGLWVGGYVSLPLKVGRAFWIAPEINVYRPLKEDILIYQGGLALLFGGPERPPAPEMPPPAWGPPPPGYPPAPGYPPPPPNGYPPPPNGSYPPPPPSP
jgi:hypothetical protein